MKKHLLLFLLAFFTTILPGLAEELEFTKEWNSGWVPALPTTTQKKETTHVWNGSNDSYQITVYQAYAQKNSSYYRLTMPTSSYIILPKFDQKVEKISVYFSPNGSTNGSLTISETASGDEKGTIKGISNDTDEAILPIKDGKIGDQYKIQNASTKQLVITTIKIYFAEEEVGIANPVLNPANGSTVKVGDVLTISCATEGAKLSGIIGEDVFEDETSPYSYTFKTAGIIDVWVYAEKGEDFSDDIKATYTVEMATPGGGETIPSETEYVLVSSTKDLVEGGYYVLAYDTDNKNYAASYTESGNIPAKEITVMNNSLKPTDETLIFTLKNLKNNNDNDDYWYWVVTNEGNRKGFVLTGASSGTGTSLSEINTDNTKTDYSKTTVSFSDTNVKIVIDATSRDLRGYSSSDFRAYASNATQGIKTVKLYKKFEADEKPSTPVVKIGDEVLENGGNKIIPTNTVLTITSENAASIVGSFGEENIELTATPFVYTISSNGTLSIKGKNEGGESETFTYTFTIGKEDLNMPKKGSRFKQVKSLDELIEGEYYVIANSTKAMSKEPYTNGTTGMASTDNYEYIPQINTGSQSFSTVTITGKDVLIVKLEKQGDDWGIKTVNYGNGYDVEQGYLSNPTSTFLSVDVSGEFIVSDININSSYNTEIRLNGNTAKLASSGNYFNMAGGNAIQLYRYTKAQKYEYEGVFSDIALRVAEEAYSYVPSVEGEHPNFVYSVPNNQNRITVEDNALVVNPKATYGDVKVSVSWDESDEWFGGSTSFVVSILEPIIESNMDFRYSVIYGKLDVGVATQAVYYDGDGAVTYYITDQEGNDVSNEIRINPETGMIRPEDLVSPVVEKIYVVTAKALETVNYTACEASYIIIIHAPDFATPDISGATFDFVNNGYGMFDEFKSSNTGGTSNSLQNYFENNINEKYTHTPVSEFVESPVSIKMTGNYRWILYDAETNGDNKMQFRMHKGATMTFSVPAGQGYAIRRIKFNGNDKATSKYLTTTLGSWSDDQTTWLASDDKTTTVEFKDPTGDKGETIWIYTIDVDLIAPSVNQFDEVGLSFDNSPEEVEHYINTFVGDITQLPKLKHHENLDFKDVVFGIDEFSDNKGDDKYLDYTIQNVDFENLSVIINEPGIYTFRAAYDPDREENVGTNKFLKGMAILRLNVFPRLEVVPHPESDNALADDPRTNNPELTLVHSTTNEAGVESATIQLPSIGNLGNDLKYSTVKVNKVVVKHGADVTVYKDKSQNEQAASKRARIAAASDDDDEANVKPEDVKDITEVPDKLDFTQDGYVKYSIVYANTPDFSIEEKVHVVLMPAVTAEAKQEDKSLTLTPLNGSTLQYYIYWFDNTFPEYPGSTASDGQEPATMSILTASTDMNTWNTSTESVTVVRPNEAGENEDVLYAVRYRAAKDIEDVVTEIESIDNNDKMLYSDYVATGISSSGTTTGVEGIVVDRDDNDAPAVYYNLQGVRMDGRRLAPGVYICVKGSTSTKVLVGK